MTFDQVSALFAQELPGWWWTVGDCEVSSHASCGVQRGGPDEDLLHVESGIFDEGFHADVRKPSTPAIALLNVLMQAKAAKETYKRALNLPDRSSIPDRLSYDHADRESDGRHCPFSAYWTKVGPGRRRYL
jgi:hypothetical protein